MSLRLSPIERPSSLMMRLAYAGSRKKFGKVITPMSTVMARMPLSLVLWVNKIQKLDKKLPVSAELGALVRIQTAQINVCEFCIDISQAFAIQYFKDAEKFHHTLEYASWPGFTDKERAVLRFTHDLVALRKVSDEVYRSAARYCTEPELCGIAWMVASEHVYNIVNIAFEIGSDGLCRVPPRTGAQYQSAPTVKV